MSILACPKRKQLVLPYRQDVATLLGKGLKIVDHPKHGKHMVMPHDRASVRLLRNFGLDAPAPILTQYDWSGDTPFETQKKTAELLSVNSRAYILSTMGTGKTRAALYAADYLMKTGEIFKGLIVAPLSTLTNVWEQEIFKCFPHRSSLTLHGTRKKRLELLEEPADFYIVNHDGIHIIQEAIKDRVDINLVIIDETAAFRNGRTRRFKSMKKVVSNRKYVWGLTGAPTPNEPADAWAQCRLITPERVPNYFGRFKDKTMIKVSQFRWVPRKEANDIVAEAMKPSVRFTREETVELPPVSFRDVVVPLSKEQTHLYDGLMKRFQTEYATKKITAVNEGVRLSKLLQVCCGYVYSSETGDTRSTIIPDHADRIAALDELIAENDRKTIVFVPYIHACEGIFRHVSKKHSAALINGSTPKKDRDKIFTMFQQSDTPRVLIAHPQTMAHGLTLTAANTIVWYSPTMSLEIYLQANARISRPSQTHKQLIVHMIGAPVEKRVYKRLSSKGKMQGTLLGMLSGIDEGL